MNRIGLLAVCVLAATAACGSDSTMTSDSAMTTATPTSASSTTPPPPAPTASLPSAPTTLPTTTTVASVDPRLTVEPLDGLAPNCSESGCTTVAFTPSGELVVYDPSVSALVFRSSGRTVPVDPALGTWIYLVAIGPDDVAYVAFTPADASDPIAALIAIPTTGPSAGREVARSAGDLDGSGDSTLIATARGVMQVGCCGFEDRLPPLGNMLALPWVTPAGEPSGVVLPEVFLEYPASRTETIVVRSETGVETRWTVPAQLAGRDMPPVLATDDGGALVWMYDEIGDPDTPAVLYDLRPDGSIETYSMGDFSYPSAMHPTRVLVVYDGDEYVQIQLP